MIDFTSTPIYAEAASRVLTDSTESAGTGAPAGSTMLLGANTGTNGSHVALRFDTSNSSALGSALLTFANTKLTVTCGAAGTPGAGCDFVLWASEFGTTIDHFDYNRPASNKFVKLSEAVAYDAPNDVMTGRVSLDTIILSNVAYTTASAFSVVIPSRFLFRGAGAVSDFEIRPSISTQPTSGQTITIYGPAFTGTATSKPKLTGYGFTDAEVLDGQTAGQYRFMAVGGESWVGFALETTEGVAEKVVNFLDFTDSGLDSFAERINSNARSKQRHRPRKSGIGRSGAGGPVTFEITPERWTPLLRGFFKLVSTGGLVNGSYLKTFKTGAVNEVSSFTLVQRKGAFRELFYGARPSSLSISANLDAAAMATANFVAIDKIVHDTDSAGENDEYLVTSTAGYDTVDNGLLTFVGGEVTFDEGSGELRTGDCVQSFNIEFNQSVNERRGFNGLRRPSRTYVSIFSATVRMSLYFDNDHQYRKFFGDAGRAYPYEAGCQLTFQKVRFKLRGKLCEPIIGGASTQQLTFTFPKLAYDTITVPINSDDALMMDCTATANFSDSDGTGVIVELNNAEPATAFAPSSPAQIITVLPPHGTKP